MNALPRTNGFTLIELIMVMVVVGALSVFVVPRFFNQSTYDTLTFQQELKTAIRYAHKLSIASGCAIQVSPTINSYALFYPDAGCTPPYTFGINPVNHPVQTAAYADAAPTGVSIAGFGAFYFNPIGAPSASGSITINPGGRTIVVNAVTGFIQ